MPEGDSGPPALPRISRLAASVNGRRATPVDRVKLLAISHFLG